MAICKITFNGNTLMDLSSDSVEKETLVLGETAHSANGEQISGALDLNARSGFYVDENGLLYFMYKG